MAWYPGAESRYFNPLDTARSMAMFRETRFSNADVVNHPGIPGTGTLGLQGLGDIITPVLFYVPPSVKVQVQNPEYEREVLKLYG